MSGLRNEKAHHRTPLPPPSLFPPFWSSSILLLEGQREAVSLILRELCPKTFANNEHLGETSLTKQERRRRRRKDDSQELLLRCSPLLPP